MAAAPGQVVPQWEPGVSITFQIPVRLGSKASGRKLEMKIHFLFQHNNKAGVQTDKSLASSDESQSFGTVQLEPGNESKSTSVGRSKLSTHPDSPGVLLESRVGSHTYPEGVWISVCRVTFSQNIFRIIRFRITGEVSAQNNC